MDHEQSPRNKSKAAVVSQRVPPTTDVVGADYSSRNASTSNANADEHDDNDIEIIDRLEEDLVLHEGDGKISRPIKPVDRLSSSSTGRHSLKTDTTTNPAQRNGGGSSTFQKLKHISSSMDTATKEASAIVETTTTTTTNTARTINAKSAVVNAALTNNHSKALNPKPPPRLDGATKRVKKATPASTRTSKEYLTRVRQKSGFVAQDSDLSEDEEVIFNAQLGNHPFPSAPKNARASDDNHYIPPKLTNQDIEIFQRLEDEYGRALEEREIGYNARYTSVRQSAFLSVFFLLAYMTQGTIVFMHQTEWSIPESLFFSIFTITTVGYGREDLPTTPSFQAYTIFYILIGVAALTIVVAQVYQCIALEASRAQHSQDKMDMTQRGFDVFRNNPNIISPNQSVHWSPRGRSNSASGHSAESLNSGSKSGTGADEIIAPQASNVPSMLDTLYRWTNRTRRFFQKTELGRGMSVIFPFAGLILLGAVVVGPMEGWTFLEALYFSVVSLTTVGFGDYVPTELASIWFCIFWLPFSIGFMSMYLGNVAAFYIRLSDKNVRRIERNLRRRLQKAKERAEQERAEVLRRAYRGQEEEIEFVARKKDRDEMQQQFPSFQGSSEHGNGIPLSHAKCVVRRQKKQQGFDILPTSGNDSDHDDELFGSADAAAAETGNRRRERIIENSKGSALGGNNNSSGETDGEAPSINDRTMKSMKDVIRAVRNSMSVGEGNRIGATDMNTSQFMSIRSNQIMTSQSMIRSIQTRKPSFALRVLVQERFAEIIAIEVAGFHSSIEIKDLTLSVTIDSLNETADKWSVPRRARKAFRAVAFEVLYFVGEHGLITRGADALYDLTPFEFHGLFSSLVAAMGDADTMEGWLESTDTLALVDLQRTGPLKESSRQFT